MNVVNLEKKILIGLVVGLAGLIAVASIVVWMKRQAPAEELQSGVDMGFSSAKTSAGAEGPEGEHKSPIATKEADPRSKEIAVGKREGKTRSGVIEITWEQLYELDYRTGKMPDSLRKLHKKRVRMPGFIVPLSDDLTALKEFLLVPNAQACIHVPPPPPNLIVYSILDRAIPIDKVSNPSWLEGTLLIETSESEYGEASYKMLVEKLEEYKF